MQSDIFTKYRHLDVRPDMSLDVFDEWLASVIERTIYIADDISISKLLNKEVVDYLDTSDIISLSKLKLQKLEKLNKLDYLDYSSRKVVVITSLLLTLYANLNVSSKICDSIRRTKFYNIVNNDIIKDKLDTSYRYKIREDQQIKDNKMLLHYNKSKRIDIRDRSLVSLKIT